MDGPSKMFAGWAEGRRRRMLIDQPCLDEQSSEVCMSSDSGEGLSSEQRHLERFQQMHGRSGTADERAAIRLVSLLVLRRLISRRLWKNACVCGGLLLLPLALLPLVTTSPRSPKVATLLIPGDRLQLSQKVPGTVCSAPAILDDDRSRRVTWVGADTISGDRVPGTAVAGGLGAVIGNTVPGTSEPGISVPGTNADIGSEDVSVPGTDWDTGLGSLRESGSPRQRLLRVLVSFELCFAAQLCFLIAVARSCSTVDFRGDYRVWKWLSAQLFAVGFFFSSSLVPDIEQLIMLPTGVGGSAPAASRHALWVVPASAVFLCTLFKISKDMRRFRTSQILLTIGLGLGLVLAVSPLRGNVQTESDFIAVLQLLTSGLILSGCLLHTWFVLYRNSDPPQRSQSLQFCDVADSVRSPGASGGEELEAATTAA